MRSIIVMAHNLGLEVIAEGVETVTQAAFLRAEKCEELQGYLYAKPLPAADFEAFICAPIATARSVTARRFARAEVFPATSPCSAAAALRPAAAI